MKSVRRGGSVNMQGPVFSLYAGYYVFLVCKIMRVVDSDSF